MITFDEFNKLNLVVATVTHVARVPDTDRLLKLTLNIGQSEPRIVVSGIAEHFPNETELVGKQVVVLANLEPRTIRGIESQGMILAVSGDDSFALITPTSSVPPGSTIS